MCQYNAAIITRYSVAIGVGANWYTFSSAWSMTMSRQLGSDHRSGPLQSGVYSFRLYTHLNHSARHAQLNIYHLISLLHDEARLVNIQVKLVSEGRIRQDHRSRYANLQGRIFRYWGEFAARERDATSLLRACSRVNGPQM